MLHDRLQLPRRIRLNHRPVRKHTEMLEDAGLLEQGAESFILIMSLVKVVLRRPDEPGDLLTTGVFLGLSDALVGALRDVAVGDGVFEEVLDEGLLVFELQLTGLPLKLNAAVFDPLGRGNLHRIEQEGVVLVETWSTVAVVTSAAVAGVIVGAAAAISIVIAITIACTVGICFTAIAGVDHGRVDCGGAIALLVLFPRLFLGVVRAPSLLRNLGGH